MSHTRLIPAIILCAPLASPAQIVSNGDFATGDIEPWYFYQDPNAEPAMAAVVEHFQDSLMFRLNPGHDGSGGWAGGTLEQIVFLEPRIVYIVSGELYIQNLRSGTNSNGGRLTVALNEHEIFHADVGQVTGFQILSRHFQEPFRSERGGAYRLSIRFRRPWRNSNPVSIYHWADNISIARLPCYANCNSATTEPRLSVDDFICFINEFAIAQNLPHEEQVNHYANCDKSTLPPILNVDDFICFINQFAQGCP